MATAAASCDSVAVPHRQLIRNPFRIPADTGMPRRWGMRRTRPAAGAFEQGGAPEAERLGGGDAPVPGDEQQPVQAASGTGADEDGAAELVGDVVTDLKNAIRDRRLFSPRTGLSGAEAADGR